MMTALAKDTMLAMPADPQALILAQQENNEQLGRCVGQLASMLAVLQQEVAAMQKDHARRITVNHQQAKGLMARIRERAEAICAKYALDPRVHGAAFRAACKKAVLQSYGIDDLHDLPLCDLELAMQQIDSWTSYALVRKRRAMNGGV